MTNHNAFEPLDITDVSYDKLLDPSEIIARHGVANFIGYYLMVLSLYQTGVDAANLQFETGDTDIDARLLASELAYERWLDRAGDHLPGWAGSLINYGSGVLPFTAGDGVYKRGQHPCLAIFVEYTENGEAVLEDSPNDPYYIVAPLYLLLKVADGSLPEKLREAQSDIRNGELIRVEEERRLRRRSPPDPNGRAYMA